MRLGINKSTGAQRALKVIAKNRFNPNQEKILKNEVNIHKNLDHPNIAKLFEYFRDENRYYLVTEICSGGELWQKIKKHTRFQEPMVKYYMRQILKVTNYMHAKNIVHRDLKPENFLIDGSDNSLKLIDFGLSIELEKG